MNYLGAIAAAVGLGAGLVGCGAVSAPFRDRSDLVAEPTVCAPVRFDIYFDEGQARLTAPARQLIGAAATELRRCDIRHVRVVGLADATGRPAANLSLSGRRAVAVAEALASAGLPAPAFDLEAAGAAGAVTATGANEPLHRRTEVLIDAHPR